MIVQFNPHATTIFENHKICVILSLTVCFACIVSARSFVNEVCVTILGLHLYLKIGLDNSIVKIGSSKCSFKKIVL